MAVEGHSCLLPRGAFELPLLFPKAKTPYGYPHGARRQPTSQDTTRLHPPPPPAPHKHTWVAKNAAREPRRSGARQEGYSEKGLRDFQGACAATSGDTVLWDHEKMLKVPRRGQRLGSLERGGAGEGPKGRKEKLASLQATRRERAIRPMPTWTTGEEPQKASLEAVDQGLSIAP